jgi:PAS domain S-box-containing protein
MDTRNAVAFLEGGGEMGARMRAFDWAATALGAPDTWPQSLRTIVRIMLDSRYAMWMLWGPDLTFFCNDAYLPTVGLRRDWVLGARADRVWAEIWPDIGPRIDHVLRTGEATWDEGLLLFLERSGYPEETYHTFSYSPVYDDVGHIAGMLCVVTEDTLRLISERRIALLGAIGTDMAAAKTEAEVFEVLHRHLGGGVPDLPCSVTYLRVADARRAARTLATGFADSHPAAPPVIDDDTSWPVLRVLDDATTLEITDLAARMPELPANPWREPPRAALLLPIRQRGDEAPAGVFVACLNRYRPLDDAYRHFVELVVAQLASGLANARAYAAERRRAEALAELDRAKTTFFSNVSHELRTPLTLMIGPLEDLLRDDAHELGSDARASLQIAHRNGLRLRRLVDSLLDFSRLEAGRLAPQRESIDAGAYTTDLASMFRAAIERAGLAFDVDAPAGIPAHVDTAMWEKIVFNLLSNAFKHTLAGSIRVQVASEGESIVLRVADTGVGIPPHALPHVFDRFYRVPNVRARTHEGAGIGLALVHELVRLMGGTIAVESEAGAGTTFTVAMPRHAADADDSAAAGADATGERHRPLVHAHIEEAAGWLTSGEAAEASPSRPAAQPAEASPTVLLVDDNADMRTYLQRLLSARFDVVTAANGEEALAAVEQRLPDLVLTDVMMPRLDGFELLKALRTNERTREIPVVLLSARAGEDSRVEGLDAGADDYLLKPFSARELHARVASNLALARARRSFVQAARDSEARRGFLLTLSDALRAAPSAEAVAHIALAHVGRQLRAACAAYGVVERDGRTLRVVTEWRADGSAGYAPNARFDVERFGEEEARGAGAPIVIEDTRRHPHADAWQQAGIGAVITAPLITGGRSAEIMWVSMPGPRAWDAEEVALLRDTAARAWTEMSRARAEVALRESEERFRTMADSSPLMVWVVDAQGRFEFANRAVLECFDTTLDALRRDGWTPHLHPDDAEGYAAEVAAALAERRSFSVMGRVRRCDGEWRWIQSVGAPRLSSDGECLGAVGSSPDITELIAASDTLRETDRRKDEFLATLAHELRNPLAPIRQAARLAQSETATVAQRRWSQQVIERQVRHMALLLDDLLDVSRITRGRLELRRQRVQLARVIDAALETARPLLDERRQTLALELPVEPLLLDADPLRLSQVISNLLANAAKYSEPGGRVVLRAQAVNGCAEISVRDTGVGIEADALPRIFEMFAQAKSSLDRAEGGLGIGLALVKGLVELHGGTVEAQSDGAGKGALFVVRLPLPTAVDAAERDDALAANPSAAQRMRILVADDNRDAAASLATLLEIDGHEVAVVHDGEAALESAAAWKPHVALLDIGMPKRNGYEVAQHIRAAPWGQAMKLVAVTGWGQAEDKRRAREAGFDRHFTKPLDLDALGAFLGDAVGARRDA